MATQREIKNTADTMECLFKGMMKFGLGLFGAVCLAIVFIPAAFVASAAMCN